MGQPSRKLRKPPDILRPYIVVDIPDQAGEWKAKCPLHDDSDPSAYFNFSKGVWVCHKGCGRGPIRELIEELKERGEGGDDSELDNEAPEFELNEEVVQDWQDNLAREKEHKDEFIRRRGLTENTIDEFQIGWSYGNMAYTIPIRDAKRNLINCRFYRLNPGAAEAKYQNLKGYGRRSLCPASQLKQKNLVLAEGELDALICIQNGIPALSVTGGAGNWNKAWNPSFRGKKVWIVYDRDTAGVNGANTVAQNLAKFAKAVYVVDLPYEVKQDHGNDITDFLVRDGYSIEEFKQRLKEVRPRSKKEKKKNEKPRPIRVIDSFSSENVGKTLEMRGTVIGRTYPTHVVPKAIKYECTQDASPTKCNQCPMLANGGHMEAKVDADDTFILKFIDVADDKKDDLVRDFMGIQKCNRMVYDVGDTWSVEKLIVRPPIDHATEEEADNTQRRVIAVGTHDTKQSETVRFIGTTAPGPKDQANEFQAWDLKRDSSAFDAFVMTDEIAEQLKMFQTDGPPLKKLMDIAEDLSQNVTSIYGRVALHMAIDLTYHSVISFKFGGKPVDKGWLDILVIGDTRTGKSETAKSISDHYGFGEMISCESVSFAGIFGGLSQKGGKEWVVVWGIIPLNDRRLVILDEVAGIRPEEIAQLSAIRSSGVAKLQKIESQVASARTRLVWLANPRDGKRLADFQYGVQAIRPLIGNLEDISRFDFALTARSNDVSIETVNRPTHIGNPRYPREAARNLILWAWSRKSEHIEFSDEATDAIHEASGQMAKKYVEDPPLVQGANVRMKLARVAVAMAVRLFSTDETHQKVLVKKEHALAAHKFLDRLYSNESFGYATDSHQRKEAVKHAVHSLDDAKSFLYRDEEFLRFLKRTRDGFTRQDVEEELNCSREHANGLISWLAKNDLTKREGRETFMQPLLLDILREID